MSIYERYEKLSMVSDHEIQNLLKNAPTLNPANATHDRNNALYRHLKSTGNVAKEPEAFKSMASTKTSSVYNEYYKVAVQSLRTLARPVSGSFKGNVPVSTSPDPIPATYNPRYKNLADETRKPDPIPDWFVQPPNRSIADNLNYRQAFGDKHRSAADINDPAATYRSGVKSGSVYERYYKFAEPRAVDYDKQPGLHLTTPAPVRKPITGDIFERLKAQQFSKEPPMKSSRELRELADSRKIASVYDKYYRIASR